MSNSVEVDILINDVYKPYLKSRSRYLILKGGAGSGKSVFAAQKTILRCLETKGERILVIRKVATTLKGSVFQLFVDMLVNMDLYRHVIINQTEKRIKFPNGSEVLMAGLDDPEKIKSIAGITSVFVEEATELSEADFNQLELRVRGETPSYKQFILCFNPIDEGHWLKKRFFDNRDSETATLTTTYKDNEYLDTDYITHLENRLKSNENLYRIYALGEWGMPMTGAEFIKTFSRDKHTGHYPYNPDLPIHLSFDFNVHPGMHWVAAQIVGKDLKIIGEKRSQTPRNNTKGSCYDFKAMYPNHNSGLFVYGDPSGRNEGTRGESGSNDFRIIEMDLADYRPQMRILTKAPSVAMNGQWISEVFRVNEGGVSISIDNQCTYLIDDLLYTQEAADGGINKARVKDPETGISYEKHGHLLDCLRYLVTYAFMNEYETFQKGGVKELSIMGTRSKGKW
jgi:hypothetical protein